MDLLYQLVIEATLTFLAAPGRVPHDLLLDVPLLLEAIASNTPLTIMVSLVFRFLLPYWAHRQCVRGRKSRLLDVTHKWFLRIAYGTERLYDQ